MNRKEGVIPHIWCLSQDPNIVWLARHMGQVSGSSVEIGEHIDGVLSRTKHFPDIMLLDAEGMVEPNLFREFIGSVKKRHPNTVLLCLTSEPEQLESLNKLGVHKTFLRPYLIENMYSNLFCYLNQIKGDAIKKNQVIDFPGALQAKILIVDDEIEVCEFLKDVFEDAAHANFQVAFSQDSEKALKQVYEFEPEIMIVDLKLPRMSGMELIERLKKEPVDSLKDFLIFTGADSPDELEWLEASGYPYLIKPCNMEQLLSAVSGICHRWNLIKKAA